MNKEILRKMGFKDLVDLVDSKKCPFCKQTVYLKDFKDELSKKEYTISGLCQKCQDETFKG